MFGLFYLAIILFYVLVSVILSKLIKKVKISLHIYWLIVVLVPTWFFAGHYLYPSNFEFKALCETATVNTYSYGKNRESMSKNIWLVSDRLVKRIYVDVDKSGGVVHESVSFTYYPFGTKANILGAASGSPPSQSCSSKSNLSEFINKHINISPLKQQTTVLGAKSVSVIDLLDSAKIERGRSGDDVWCDSKVVGYGYNDSPGLSVSYFIHELRIQGRHDIEKTICTAEHIYVVETPGRGREFIKVHVYDYQGNNLKNFKYTVPSRVWTGYPRKALIYFEDNLNYLKIGIDEFGENMESTRIYYNLKLTTHYN